jgi:Pycsar effector protein
VKGAPETPAVLREEIKRSQNDTQQADGKASILLAVLAFQSPLAVHVHSRWAWAGWVLLGTAAALLGAAVMPRLTGPSCGWFGAYATARTSAEALARIGTSGDPEALSAQLVRVSRIALTKYRLIQAALLLMAGAAGVFALAAVVGGRVS